MPVTTTIIEPDADAWELARTMSEHDEVMRLILDETLDAAAEGQIMESGRTVCPTLSRVKSPLDRFPTSVRLPTCPRGYTGVWHTHATPDELRNPRNSVPDLATVALGEFDVVNVTGTRTAEFFVAADDRELLAERFNEILGGDFSSSREVAEAIMVGDIDTVAARRAAETELSELFKTTQTGFSDLDADIDEFVLVDPMAYDMHNVLESEMVYAPRFRRGGTYTDEVRRKKDQCYHALSEVNDGLPVNVGEVAFGAAIGTIVGTLVERFVFGR